MKYLLDNALAPITFSCGFLEIPLDVAREQFFSWVKTFEQSAESTSISASLPEALRLLPPLTGIRRRIILLEAGSAWTVYFDNSINGSDPEGAIGHLSQTLKCRGLVVGCRPHIRNKSYGAVSFVLYGPEQTDWLNMERSIWAGNDGGRWTFETAGKQLPFEMTEKYEAKRVRDRFTPEMLEEYAHALGIHLFDPGFYGPEGLLINIPKRLPPGGGHRSLTLEEAQSLHGIT